MTPQPENPAQDDVAVVREALWDGDYIDKMERRQRRLAALSRLSERIARLESNEQEARNLGFAGLRDERNRLAERIAQLARERAYFSTQTDRMFAHKVDAEARAEAAEARVAELERERDEIGASLGEPCAECGHVDWRSDGYLDAVLHRREDAYAALEARAAAYEEALRPILKAIVAASETVVYLPVQRQNMHGGQMSPDTMAAIPVPLWEALCEAYDVVDETARRALDAGRGE